MKSSPASSQTSRESARKEAADQIRDIQQARSKAAELASFLKSFSEASSRLSRAAEEMRSAASSMSSLAQQRSWMAIEAPHSILGATGGPPSPAPVSGSPREGAAAGATAGRLDEEEKQIATMFDQFQSLSTTLQCNLQNLSTPLAVLSKEIQNDLCTKLSLVEDGERAFQKVFQSLEKAEKRVQDCAQKSFAASSSYQKLIELEDERDQLLDLITATGQVILTASGITLRFCTLSFGGGFSRFLLAWQACSATSAQSFQQADGLSFWTLFNQHTLHELNGKANVIGLAQSALQNPQTPVKLLKTIQRESKRDASWSRMKSSQTNRPAASTTRSSFTGIGASRSTNNRSTTSESSSPSPSASDSSRASVPHSSPHLVPQTIPSSSSSFSSSISLMPLDRLSTSVSSSEGGPRDDSSDDSESEYYQYHDDDEEDDYPAGWESSGGSLALVEGEQAALPAGERVPREGVWTFEVEKICRRRLKRKTLMIDAGNDDITLYDVTSQRRRVLPGNKLINIRRSNVNPRKVKLFWLNRATPERFLFYTKEKAERFNEAQWALRGPNPGQASKELTIFFGTWNLGNAPAPDDLTPWLPANPDHDIYVVTVQECEYSLRDGKSNEDDWFGQVVRHFGERYYRLAGISLLHIRMIVLIRRTHYSFVSNVKRASEATGIANVIGNKGGTGIFFSIYGTRLCFIGAHLAAHLERVNDRNANYRDIMKGLNSLAVDDLELTTYPHHIFFAGDLNYRLDLPREEAIRLIEQKKWFQLLISDQLLQQIQKFAAFPGFSEGLLTFPPTYRYNRGDRSYSTEKMRVPSWCDRVLWKSQPGCHLEQVSYSCCDSIMSSDHSPVAATFRITASLPVPKALAKEGPSQPRRYSIRFLSFRAQLQPRGTKTEPYIHLTGDFLEAAVTTVAIAQTNTPSWNPDGIPSLLPIIDDIDFLRRQHIFVTIKDKAGEPWGQCAIPLSELCSAQDPTVPVHFKSQIWRHGLSPGEISCSYALAVLHSGGAPATPSAARSHRKAGYLLKEGGFRKNWKRRWFVLTSAGHLEYYDNETVAKPISAFSVSGRIIRVDQDAGKANCIAIETPKRLFRICADDAADLTSWLNALLEFGNKPVSRS